jgi:hypothetical protein
MKLSTLSRDHLGLVVAIFDALGISELIDGLIPKTRECRLSHSEIINTFIYRLQQILQNSKSIYNKAYIREVL